MSEAAPVTLRDRNIKEPKEVGEVFDAIEGLIGAIKGEGSSSEKIARATAQLPAVVTAVEGYEKIENEVKDKSFFQSAGAFVGRVIALFS